MSLLVCRIIFSVTGLKSKKEMNKKVDENTNKNRVIKMDIKKDIKKDITKESPPVNKEMEYNKFFSLMEKDDSYKEKKRELKKVETKKQPSNVKEIHQPMNIIQAPPVSKNPYDIYFKRF